MSDDTVYDGTGLPPETTTEQQAPVEAPETSGGDGPAYEAGGASAGTGQGEPETVAASDDQQSEQQPESLGSASTSQLGADTTTWTSSPSPVNVPGTYVQSETAGTGPAVNANTGEVIWPGQPLPPITQQPDDTQEIPAQTDHQTTN